MPDTHAKVKKISDALGKAINGAEDGTLLIEVTIHQGGVRDITTREVKRKTRVL